MQSGLSPFLVNIIPLQNIQSNVSGLDSGQALSNQVAEIRQMVNFDQKKIFTNVLASYTTGAPINVVSPLNLSNVGLYSNSNLVVLDVSGGGGGGGGTALISGDSRVQVFSTLLATDVGVRVGVDGASNAFIVYGGGNAVYNGGVGTEFKVSTSVLKGDTATFSGQVFATGFVTLSDYAKKSDVVRFPAAGESVLEGIGRVGAWRYRLEGEEDIGLLAQEVEAVFPECVATREDGVKYVKVGGLIAVLWEAIRELRGRG